jgi:hypothetical protein
MDSGASEAFAAIGLANANPLIRVTQFANQGIGVPGFFHQS